MRYGWSALFVFFAVGSLASCSVLNNMDGYAGGSPADIGANVDSTTLLDSALADSIVATDTFVNDAIASDTYLDTSPADVADETEVTISDTGTDAGDTAPPADTGICGGAFSSFGLSEIMVRAVFGGGDRHEWLEVTNYGSTALDVSGVIVQVRSATGADKATFTIPTGTNVAAGDAVVFAGDKATFVADVTSGFALGTVFDLGKTGDVIINSGFEVRLTAPGCTTPYETTVGPSKTWPIGQAYAYPPPSTACPANTRVTSTNAFAAPWKDVRAESAYQYGSIPGDAGPQPLYGTPTKANVGVACP